MPRAGAFRGVDRPGGALSGFTAHARANGGRFHNRLGPDRERHDEPGLGDWWGRASWGLGTAAARCPVPWIRRAALACFDRSAHHRPSSVRAMSFAALGAAEVLSADADRALAAKLLGDVSSHVGEPGDAPDWPWPEHRLFYANAVLPEALIAAGDLLDDPRIRQDGLRLLDWLLTVESREARLSPTPAGGWRIGEPRPAFDQQPVEVAALADACARAHQPTGDLRWQAGVRHTIAWFGGADDLSVPVHDKETGGYDGLTPGGPDRDQGAESTPALISTLRHGRTPATSRTLHKGQVSR